MEKGFQNKTLDVRTGDGADDVLLEPLLYIASDGKFYRVPIGGSTDGISTPSAIRNIPGFNSTGDDWFSGVLHDSAYRNELEVCDALGIWSKANLTQDKADALILDAMESQGVGFIRRHTIYRALRMFGSFAFASDRAK